MLGKFSFIIDSGFLRKFAIVAFAFVLSSCAYTRNFAPWNLWPGDWGKKSPDSPIALIMDIKERGIYTRKINQTYHLKDKNGKVVKINGKVVKRKRKQTILCAEPSPDALSATSAAADAGYKGAKLGLQVATTAAYVGLRTQTIQLLRDAMYRLCEATLNEQITEEEYRMLFKNLSETMITLLAIEQLTGVVRAPPVIIYSEIETASAADPEQPAKKIKGGGMIAPIIKVEPFNDKTAESISRAVVDILRQRGQTGMIFEQKDKQIKALLEAISMQRKAQREVMDEITSIDSKLKPVKGKIEELKTSKKEKGEIENYIENESVWYYWDTKEVKEKKQELEKVKKTLGAFPEKEDDLLARKKNLEKEKKKLENDTEKLSERINNLLLGLPANK